MPDLTGHPGLAGYLSANRIAPSTHQRVVRVVQSALADPGGNRVGVTIADDDGFATIFVATGFEVNAFERERVRTAVRAELADRTRYPGSITVIFIPRAGGPA